ncbi:PadR family transcriptional regulator [Actinomyces vulturis]|uniref:PadR family transcriptional regulator n=1 Tax=Actinomyces vulturis TaxID=1857645 RepID=UPI0009F2926B
MKSGTLSRILTRWESSGLLVPRGNEAPFEPGRKFFHLTDHGLDELNSLSTQWTSFSASLNALIVEGGRDA